MESNYVNNGYIKELNTAILEKWQFYMNTCFDKWLFYKLYRYDNKQQLTPKQTHRLYMMANLPDKTLIEVMNFPKDTNFSEYRFKFAKFIINEGKAE